MKAIWITVVFAFLIAPVSLAGDPQPPIKPAVEAELSLLPFYSVFDVIEVEASGTIVTLKGKVSRESLKTDAEAAAKRVPGVSVVENRIETLPCRPCDDRIRLAAYKAFCASEGLNRYVYGAEAGLHIIVENRNILLHGTVQNEQHRDHAETLAKNISEVEAVVNHLLVQRQIREVGVPAALPLN